jgi:hypothetical protein
MLTRTMIFLPSVLPPSFLLSIDVSAKCVIKSRIINRWLRNYSSIPKLRERHLKFDKELRTIDSVFKKGPSSLELDRYHES